MVNVHIDFETRSRLDVTEVGSWKYSTDPSTRVLCLVFKAENSQPALITEDDLILETGDIDFLKDLAKNPDNIFKAYNSLFEYCIWHNILVKQYGFPEIPLERWDCTAAKAATHALPRALGKCATALRLSEEKDETGKRVMMSLSKPRKPSKNNPSEWDDDPKKFDILYDYCRQDVIVENAIDEALPDLNPREKRIWLLDQKINLRGVQIDVEALEIAIRYIEEYSQRLNKELERLTCGEVAKATERDKLLKWLQNYIDIPNIQAGTVEEYKNSVNNPKVKRALEIRHQLSKTSTSKIYAIKNALDDEGRVRDNLVYHGASTGRWSGKNAQFQNLPKGIGYNSDQVLNILKLDDLEFFEGMYPDVMDAISASLRGLIISKPGHDLIAADYAGIEARVVMWLAGEERGLEKFRNNEDIYCDLAREIYKREVTKKDKDERQLGKMGVLGCGYQMGPDRFREQAKTQWNMEIPYELAKLVVDTYRNTYSRVKRFWYAQERAAMLAVTSGRKIEEGPVIWKVQNDFLYCRLPSGRCLAYAEPRVQQIQTRWGEPKEGLTFMGVNAITKKWERQSTYGGCLVENITQAVSRDIMAEGMLRVEEHGYNVVLTVHDEVVTEVPENFGSVKEFEELLTIRPKWASDCPISAEGWRSKRYRK